MDLSAKKVVFSGRVQGVGFRFTALKAANSYKLTGYVCNMPRGEVEMLLQGPAETIDSCIRDLQDSFAGYIKQTDVQTVPADSKLKDFKITF
jgi:acylphosphatase